MAKGKTIAKYAVSIIADTDQLNKGFKDITKGAKKFGKEVDTQSKKSKKSFGSMFKGLKTGWLLVAGVMTGVVVAAFKKVIGLASDFQEQNSKFKTVFRGTVSEAQNFRKELTSAYGLSRLEATKFLASTQDLLVPLGIARDKATELSASTVKLARDMASFNNLPTSDVLRDVHSAMTGMFVPLKKYGVIINETILKQEAANRGIALTNGMVDAQSKALIALDLIAKGSADAIGDFARTQKSFANQSKILGGKTIDLAVNFGELLLPAATKIVGVLIKVVNGMGFLVDKIKILFPVTESLKDLTNEYAAAQKKLKDETKELTEEEEKNLNVKQKLLSEELVRKIQDYAKEYDELSNKIEKLSKQDLENFEETKRIKDEINKSLERTRDIENEIRMTNAETLTQVIDTAKARNLMLQGLSEEDALIQSTTFHKMTQAEVTERINGLEIERQKHIEEINDLQNEITDTSEDDIELADELNKLEEQKTEYIALAAQLYNDGNLILETMPDNLREQIRLLAEQLSWQKLINENKVEIKEETKKTAEAEWERTTAAKEQIRLGNEYLELLRKQKEEAAALAKKQQFKQEVAAGFGQDIATGIVSALNSGDAKSAASSLADSFADATGNAISKLLSEASGGKYGWIGSLISMFMKVLKNFTGKGFTKFANDVSKALEPLISNLVESIITSLTDPRWLLKLIITILRGIGQGIAEAFKNLFTTEWWTDFDWSFEAEPTIDREKIKQDIIDTVNDAFNLASAKLELQFELGEITNIEFIEKQIELLKNKITGLPADIDPIQLVNLNIELAGLQNDLTEAQNQFIEDQNALLEQQAQLQQDKIDSQIKEILNQDELLKLKMKAGLIPMSELEFLKNILITLKGEREQLELLAEENGYIVEDTETYLNLLVEINGIEDQIVTANMAQTAELAAQDKLMQDQLDKTSELNRLRNVAKGILGTLGIPKFQLDFLQKQIDIASFGLQKDLFSGGGFDFGEIEKLLAASSGIFSGTMVPAEAQGIQDFFGSLSGMGGTTITNQIDSLIGTLNSSQPVSVSALKPILSALLVSLERENGNE